MDGHVATASAPGLRGRDRRSAFATGPMAPLAVTALCLLAMALVWAVAELIPAVQLKDAILLDKFASLEHPPIEPLAEAVLRLLNPTAFVLWGIALVAVAFANGRPRVALAVVFVLALAPLSADILKPLLAHAHDRVGEARKIGASSWPSGHATAATALAMCAALVAPPRLRGVVVLLGTVFVVAVGASLLILQWHMPSDVVGGVLLATAWTALAVAALRGGRRARAGGPASETRPAG
jgi:membrane-associated phospholipid phosphatase